MTRKQAKAIALRKITAVTEDLVGTEMLMDYELKERMKIEKEILDYGKEFYARALKLDPSHFNKFTGSTE